MTFKELLQKEHPKFVGEQYEGGCRDCPDYYEYEECSPCNPPCSCEKCWEREIPVKEEK